LAVRRLALVALTSALVASSCSSSGEEGCQSVSATYRVVFQNGSITRTSVETDLLAQPFRVPGAWYIVTKTDGSAPVWVTDRDPRGEVLGQIITANRAAHSLSSSDFADMPLSMSVMAQAAGNPDGIAVAQACVGR
jgi:hypothetical protein